MKKRSHSNLEGQTFNHWFVLKREQDVGYIKFYKCRCKCGNIRSVRSGHLVSGNSKSCGCVHKPRKHGQARGINTPNNFPKKYRTWRSIKSRCCNPEDKYYYGLLCDEWQDYVNFDRDVPDPPSDDLTIDRIDNDKGYIPGNVRWITWTEQHRNQRNCRWIEYGGKKKLISHWARLLGMAPTTLNQRIRRHGIPKALLLKVNSQPQGLRSFNRSEVDNPKSLLTRDQVKEIYISSLSNSKLAKKFKVSKTAIYDVKKGRSWKHLYKEINNVEKFLVISHRGCVDGSAAAAVVRRWVGSREATYFACQYKEALPASLRPDADLSDKDIIIVDFSFPRDILERFAREARSLTVLDHHVSTKEQLEGIPGCYFDNDRSGAMMAWNHFFPNEPAPAIVEHVQDRDLWRFEIKDTEAVCAVAYHHLLDTQWWSEALDGWSDAQLREVLLLGNTILKIQNQRVRKAVRTAIPTVLFGFKTMLANVTTDISEVGHELLARYPEISFSTSFFINTEGKPVLSFRSRDDFDLVQIVTPLQGGGHHSAAGATVDFEFLSKLYNGGITTTVT